MGLFYTNLTVCGASRSALLTELRHLNRSAAFVGPTAYERTVVFDKQTEDQDGEVIEMLGCSVTKALNCVALAAMLHDDDVLYLWLFQNGLLLDWYDSCPAYFDPKAQPGPPVGGDAELICQVFRRSHQVNRVRQLLRADILEDELPEIKGELERHAALTVELGLPREAAGLGYSAIAGGYVDPVFRGVEFEKV